MDMGWWLLLSGMVVPLMNVISLPPVLIMGGQTGAGKWKREKSPAMGRGVRTRTGVRVANTMDHSLGGT